MNRCDICGKFRAWHDLYDEEHPSLDELGHYDANEERLCVLCKPLVTFTQERAA